MTMNMDLAAMYGTPGGPTEEDQEKVAAAEMFVKLAAEKGIDLNQYNDDEIAQIWDATFSKEAQEDGEGEPPKKKDEDKEDRDEDSEKKAAAEAEFAEMQEAQEKVAEADYCGRVMAHAFSQEMGLINESMEKEALSAAEIAAKVRGAAGAGASKARGAGKAAVEKVRGAVSGAGEKLEELGRRGVKATQGKERKGYGLRQAPEAGPAQVIRTSTGGPGAEKAISPAMAKAIGGGMVAGGTGVAGAGVYGAHKGLQKAYDSKSKGASAIDETAIELAIIKAAEAEYDIDEVGERIDALITLDALPAGEKTASAQSVDEAVEIRSLELLEAVGVPVEWA